MWHTHAKEVNSRARSGGGGEDCGKDLKLLEDTMAGAGRERDDSKCDGGRGMKKAGGYGME